MTSPLNDMGTVSNPLAVQTTATTAKKNMLDQDAFLKLLVAQLKYQDPSKPADSTAFMAQTAQFTQVQALQQVSDDQQKLLSAQLVQNASAMVGRTVTFTNTLGAETTGVVSSATVNGSDPILHIGDTDVPLSSVKKVQLSAGTTGETSGK